MRPACSSELLFFIFPMWLVRVCEIELSQMGENNGNPNLVCEKIFLPTLKGGDINNLVYCGPLILNLVKVCCEQGFRT